MDAGRQLVVDPDPQATNDHLWGNNFAISGDTRRLQWVGGSCHGGYDVHELGLGHAELDVEWGGLLEPGVEPVLQGSGSESWGDGPLGYDLVIDVGGFHFISRTFRTGQG